MKRKRDVFLSVRTDKFTKRKLGDEAKDEDASVTETLHRALFFYFGYKARGRARERKQKEKGDSQNNEG